MCLKESLQGQRQRVHIQIKKYQTHDHRKIPFTFIITIPVLPLIFFFWLLKIEEANFLLNGEQGMVQIYEKFPISRVS